MGLFETHIKEVIQKFLLLSLRTINNTWFNRLHLYYVLNLWDISFFQHTLNSVCDVRITKVCQKNSAAKLQYQLWWSSQDTLKYIVSHLNLQFPRFPWNFLKCHVLLFRWVLSHILASYYLWTVGIIEIFVWVEALSKDFTECVF